MFENQDHLVLRFTDPSSVDFCRAVVDRHFPIGEEDRFNRMSVGEFHECVYAAQRDINSGNIQDRIYQHEKSAFEREIGQSLMRESVCFLRAVRPSKKDATKSEAVGLHRETMYSDSPHEISHCVNMWFPIRGVNENSSLKYIPNSHKVPDADLEVAVDEEGPRVGKHSTGHKLGFLYSPKKIVGGVDTQSLSTFKVGYGEYVLFSSMLIHGGAANHGSEIRFSLSMAIIPQVNVVVNKSYFAAGGKSHYEQFGSGALNTR